MARSSSAAAGESEQNARIDAAVARMHDAHRLARAPGKLRGDAGLLRRVQKVGLVENDEIGAGKLILENFFERIIVVDRFDRRRVRGRSRRGRARSVLPPQHCPSTTAMTPSTVSLERIAGQSNAFTSGFGSARPEVSMMM